MKKEILILMLVMMMAVAISGCPQSSQDFNPNAGAVVDKASFDVQRVYDNEQTSLMFDIANVGGKALAANDVTVYVYGPTIGATTDVWQITPPTTPTGITATNGYITTSVTTALTAPDSSLGTPGGRQQFEVPLTPPKVLSGMEVPTNMYVSICFPYTTETITQVEVTSKNELRATGQKSSRKDSINAAGPIHVNVAGDGNIRSGTSGSSLVIPLVFKITDVGGGFAIATSGTCAADQASANRNKVSLAVTVDGATKGIDCGSGTNAAEAKLRDGSGAIYCKYTTTAGSTPRRIYNVKTTATYKYTVTSLATVTDIGTTTTA